MTTAKIRVYELAREIGVPNKDLISKIRGLGLEVNNHMSSLNVDEVSRVKRSLEKERIENTVTKRLSKTVLRRRSKKKPVEQAPEPVVAVAAVQIAPVPDIAPKKKTVTRRKIKETPELEVVATPEPAPESTVEVAAKPGLKKATPIVIKGPSIVDIPGVSLPEPPRPEPIVHRQPRPEPELESEEAETDDSTPRSRFEAELERARVQAAAKESERIKVVEDEKAEQARTDGRPEVGSIISLPMTRIKITERGPSRQQLPGQGQVRGRFAQQQRRGGGRRGRDMRKKQMKRGGGKQTQITTPAEHKRVIRIEETVLISDVAKSMGTKANEVLRKLWTMGMVGVTINHSIDFETASLLASEFGYEVLNVAFKEEEAFESLADSEEDLQLRAPVVTVMGHVDHGKTSLLDNIRNTQVTASESGGITQHIGAYLVEANENHGQMVFIDTPGHAAFTEMRARGAQATDIVILVVAADDGVMPQTIEAINHAKDANVTIIVAVNKCDLPNANPERARQQLAEHGLIPEEWGGDTIYVDVSAIKGEGVDKLLEAIALNAELLELKANPNKSAIGVVIEAKLDRNRGPMSTVLVQEGTLHIGDIVVVGEHLGKVRAMLNDKGEAVTEAGPSTPIEILGIDGVPAAGETLNATADEKMAKQVVEHRYQAKRQKELASTGRISLENLMERIQEGEAKELKIVLKADVHGSSEAIKEALTKQSTDKVSVNVISSGVGGITETDVNLAKAGGAIIVGFHVRPAGKAAKLAERENVQINIYDIIYEALDDVRLAMAGLLAPIFREAPLGTLEVRDTFTIPRRGVVAGCMVTHGRVSRKSLLRVVRESVQIFEGRVSSLRRFKDEASEVKEGFECGLMVDGFNDIQIGDVIESYEIIEEAATL